MSRSEVRIVIPARPAADFDFIDRDGGLIGKRRFCRPDGMIPHKPQINPSAAAPRMTPSPLSIPANSETLGAVLYWNGADDDKTNSEPMALLRPPGGLGEDLGPLFGHQHVCSNWADSSPSRVRTVQPSSLSNAV